MFNGTNLILLSSDMDQDTYGKVTKSEETQHKREPRG